MYESCNVGAEDTRSKIRLNFLTARRDRIWMCALKENRGSCSALGQANVYQNRHGWISLGENSAQVYHTCFTLFPILYLLANELYFLSFPVSFWEAQNATPRPAGTEGRQSSSNLLFPFRHSNWKSCLGHMARAKSQDKNKEHLLTSIPSQAHLGSWAPGWDSSVQSTNWRRVSMDAVNAYPRQALGMGKREEGWRDFRKIKVEAEK